MRMGFILLMLFKYVLRVEPSVSKQVFSAMRSISILEEQSTDGRIKSNVVNHLLILSLPNDCCKYIHMKLLLIFYGIYRNNKRCCLDCSHQEASVEKHLVCNTWSNRTNGCRPVCSAVSPTSSGLHLSFHVYPRVCTSSSSSTGKHRILCAVV